MLRRVSSNRLTGWGLRFREPPGRHSDPAPRGFVRLWQFRSAADEVADFADHGPFWREPRLARLEAVLFLSREPLSSRKIAQLANLADGSEARTLIRRLRRMYDAAGNAFQVQEIAGGYQLLTRAVLAQWMRRILETGTETRLSAPAMETLAVVAYRQPILRAEIESIRGVSCDDILRQLLDRDLLRIVGRSEDLGRPLLYGTTKRFLELFGLKNLDDLPTLAESQLKSDASAKVLNNSNATNNSGASRINDINSAIQSLEENSVTTSICPVGVLDEHAEEEAALLGSSRLGVGSPVSAVEDEDDLEEEDEDEDDDEDDEDWDDDEEDEADDDFVDDEWEEVDDDEEEDEDEEEDDEEWEDDDEDDDDWDDDDEDEAEDDDE